MNGIFYCNEVADSTTLHLLRFYDNGYVIYKKVTGNSKDYLKKELKFFAMNGHTIVGQPEFTFCGAYDENGTTIKLKSKTKYLILQIRGPKKIFSPSKELLITKIHS